MSEEDLQRAIVSLVATDATLAAILQRLTDLAERLDQKQPIPRLAQDEINGYANLKDQRKIDRNPQQAEVGGA